MIPLAHDFTGERVLVFGGGPVGVRKAHRFASEADVVLVSPTFSPPERTDIGRDESASARNRIERVRAAPEPESVDDWIDRTDPALVVAATDDAELNAAIERAAQERNLLYNRTDQSERRGPMSVAVPATVRSDPVAVAVTTGATSPALARYLREQITETIDGAGAMAELSGSLRDDLAATDIDAATRREAIRTVVRNEGVWKALDTGIDKAEKRATDVIEDVTGDPL
ncbi:precorrin-2 dehydrogenase/sirohydrochlorin ferrochelatase family protein [Halovenus marina]|uniref:precorrin-2 dehydrogenase/sirohydrochlorin ferrochelatase family protein n=1 Tax=Halovenus marina TaxID=3396621 RepID=UPI003F5781C4